LAEGLAERLRILEDREAIRDLIAHYGPLADSGQSAAVAQLWCEDGVYAIGGMAEAIGHAAIAALIDGPTHRALMADGCAHVLGPVAIDIEGDQAIAWGHSLVVKSGEGGYVIYRAASNRWTLSRTKSGWRVLRRDNRLIDGGEGAMALFAGLTPPQPAS
jgi:ketosteroid isomerase-like protein